jgi:hypothetical protein
LRIDLIKKSIKKNRKQKEEKEENKENIKKYKTITKLNEFFFINVKLKN